VIYPRRREPKTHVIEFLLSGYREEFWILDVDGTRLVIAPNDPLARRPRTLTNSEPSSTPSGSSHEHSARCDE
jgi:hypothetical protein